MDGFLCPLRPLGARVKRRSRSGTILHISDVLVDRIEAIRPVTPQVCHAPEGDVSHVDSLGFRRQLRPGGPRGAVGLKGLPQRRRIAGARVERVEDSGPQLPRKEAT